jgi:hypothetical protein
LYDTLREPVVLENAVAFQPFAVPNRVLLWGAIALPK